MRNPFVAPLILLGGAVLLTMVIFISYRYSVYAMMFMLASVASIGAFILFNSEISRFVGSLLFYLMLVLPFFVAYLTVYPQTNIFVLAIFSLISYILVVSISFLPSEFPPNMILAELFHISREYLKRRKFRFSLLVLSLTAFTAGVTALSLFLPFYAVAIPFAVTICVFGVSMSANVYERKRDIFALTALGLNPDEVQALFLLEASFAGFLGGGIGYAVGLTMVILSSIPLRGIEVSTGWVAVALLVSIATALTASVYPAFKASLLTTPSLIKKWRKLSGRYEGWPPKWSIELPVKIPRDQIESFMRYFYEYAVWLERLPPTYLENARNIIFRKVNVPGGGEEWILRFEYAYGAGYPPSIITRNEVKATTCNSGGFMVQLTVSVLSHHDINVYHALERIITTFRQMVLDWTERPNIKTFRRQLEVSTKPLLF
ncbi:FtsX-like permease family protein [Candidatus Bathyarchaeota archaeon]|nr:MAG: FtsX-like permease family protein [Candidatus Bathyarchaeota archaeon]